MPGYFYTLHEWDRVTADSKGLELAEDGAARAEAIRPVRGMDAVTLRPFKHMLS